MPTGYTIELDKDIPTEKWFMEQLVRAFGICVTLREDRILSATEIRKSLVEDMEEDLKYRKDRSKELNDEKKLIEDRTDADWKKVVEEMRNKKSERNKKNIEDTSIIKTIHDRAKKDLERVVKLAISDITKEIAKFGLEQLDAVKTETEPYIDESVTLTWEQYKEKTINANIDSIKYNTEIYKADKKAWKEKLSLFDELMHDINVLFYFPFNIEIKEKK